MNYKKVVFKNYKKSSVNNIVEGIKKRYAFKFLRRIAKKNFFKMKKQLVVFSFDYIGLKIEFDGVYEIDDLETLFKWLSPLHSSFKNGTAVDIGANIGNHSLYFSDFFSDIQSFEPNTRTFKVLNLNAELANNIICHNVGVSDRVREGVLSYKFDNIGGAKLSEESRYDAQKIRLTTLDGYLKPDKPVMLIKIDVEGHELAVLKGAENIIKNDYPIIVFEQHETEFSNGTAPSIELLRKYGYKRFASIENCREIIKNEPVLLNAIARFNFLIGRESYTGIVEKDYFEAKQYTFIIAIPEWVSV